MSVCLGSNEHGESDSGQGQRWKEYGNLYLHVHLWVEGWCELTYGLLRDHTGYRVENMLQVGKGGGREIDEVAIAIIRGGETMMW